MVAQRERIAATFGSRAGGPPVQRENGGEARDVTVARNIHTFVTEEHPDWASVLEGIRSGASDQSKMDQLLANFRRNAMGFTYAGASRNYSQWCRAVGQTNTYVRTDPPV